jgi:NAD+ synthase
MQQYDSGKKESDFKDRELEVFNIYSRLHIANLHKMLPIPVCEISAELKK